MAESLQIQTLGKLKLSLDSRDTPLRSRTRATALLVYLAVTGEPVRRERLMTLLWPEMPAKNAAHNLRQTVYTLRKQIPHVAARSGAEAVPLLPGDRQTFTLNPNADIACDAEQFEGLLDTVWRHGHADIESCEECQERLRTAVALYHGDFLSDFYLADSSPFEAWAQTVRARLQERLLSALDLLTDIALQRGELETAVRLARR